jgi:hypothetical protein
MSNIRNHARLLLILMTLGGGTAMLAACDNEGPLEQAGEQADEAINDASRAVKDAAD